MSKYTKKITWTAFKKSLVEEMRRGVTEQSLMEFGGSTDAKDRKCAAKNYEMNLKRLKSFTVSNVKAYLKHHGFDNPESFIKALKFVATVIHLNESHGAFDFECGGNPLFLGCSWNIKMLDSIYKDAKEYTQKRG